jgi:two-component system, chemotaxis family, response regulator Rcp1
VEVLLVEDSLADLTLIMEVLQDEKIAVNVSVARDGIEAMDFLLQRGKFSDAVVPDLILLDLNLPKKDGREVLKEMKSHPDLQSIPVVILTTSQAEEDIIKSYDLQASCYVTKTFDFDQFVKIVRAIDGFWFTAVKYRPQKITAPK